MKISIFYFIWILIQMRSLLKTMRYIFQKYEIDTFEIKLLWKIIRFTKERDLCESILSMESRTTWLSRYFNEYNNYPYALINLDIINPLYYNIHNCLIKSFNKDLFKNKTIKEIIVLLPDYLFGIYYNKLKLNKLIYCMKENKIKLIRKYIKYMINNTINENKTFIYKFNEKLYEYYNDDELIKNILIDNLYLILDHYIKLMELKLKHEFNKIKYSVEDSNEFLLNNLEMDYLCVRQLPFTNDYIFMDLYCAKLYFSYGIKKCLFNEVISNAILL